MELLIDRKWKKSKYTIGILYVNGARFSEVLEDADRGLNSQMSELEIKSRKIYGQTAIPTGRYEIVLTYSTKFSGRVWGKKYNGKVPELLNVKGYSGVRIHPGNTDGDTLGCLLPGRNLEKGKVLQSTEYYYKLMDSYIIPALKRNEKIYITLK